jgi:hypothetical protein
MRYSSETYHAPLRTKLALAFYHRESANMQLPSSPRLGILFLVLGSFCPQVRPAQPVPAAPVFLATRVPVVPADTPGISERPNADPRQFYVVDGVLILYYFVVYALLYNRRDSAAVVIQYTPPANLSPAQLRFLLTGDSDRKTVLGQNLARVVFRLI